MPRFIMVWTFGDILGAAILMLFFLMAILFVMALGYEKAKRWWIRAVSDFWTGKK